MRGYAVILAGGRGTRFWPLSRAHKPKQLLTILGRKSLIQETIDRIAPLFRRANTLVVAVADHSKAIRRELPRLPERSFLSEPQGNNTAPCIGLVALELMARDPDAIMTVLPADHWISDSGPFRRTIRAAMRLAEKRDLLITIGIRPRYPETGYGYILKGEKLPGPWGASAYQVRGFKEKPSLKKAAQWIHRGALWNSGIFVWKASTLLASLRRFTPSLFHSLERIQDEARGLWLGSSHPRLRALLKREYQKMASLSIDYALLEKAGAEGKVLTLEASFGWSDVGNWAALHRLLPKDREGNAAIGKWFGRDSRDCLVYSPKRLVALLGTRELVVVDTPDALLVCDLKQAQEVRDLVEELQKKGYSSYTLR